MKFKKIAGILTVGCLLLNTFSVSAAERNITYIKALDDNVENQLNIEGTVENGANREVFIRIDYPGSTLNADTNTLENYVIYQNQTTTDAEGKFTFKAVLKDQGANPYTLRLGVLGNENEKTESFVFYGKEYRDDTKDTIKEAQKNGDSGTIVNTITTNYKNLYLETPVFGAYYDADSDGNLTDVDLSAVGALIAGYDEITSVEMLAEALDGATMVVELKKAGTCEEMEQVLTTFENELGITSSTVYQTYSDLPADLQTAVKGDFTAKDGIMPSEITNGFTVSVLNTYLSNSVGTDAVKKVLEDNSALLGIDMADYSFDDSKYLDLTKTEIKDVTDVKAALDEIQADVNQGSGGSSNPGGGGSSGGSDGGSGGSGGGGSFAGGSVIPGTPVSGTDSGASVYPFNDMEKYIWAKDATLSLYNSGVLNGYGNGIFGPERIVSREELLKMVIGGLGVASVTDNDVAFGDVITGEWYYPFIKTGVNSGIINGIGDNLFGIGAPVTRQDMVVMIYRAIGMKYKIPTPGDKSSFEDFDTVSDYAREAIVFAESSEIVNGMGDGKFHPNDTASRAEAAVILYRAIEYVSNRI